MADNKSERILFLTGKLAEKRLHKILGSMQPVEFSYEVRNIGISVAALMTAQMIMRRISDVNGADRIIVPGLCRGNLSKTSEYLGIPVIRGTEDLKDLPVFFGRDCKPPDLSRYDVMIFAEITDAPMISIDKMLIRADRYKSDGADVIDIGCLPDTPFPHLEETVQALHAAGYKVSVDSLEDEELLRGGRAGADYLLSLKESTLWIADEVGSVPILISDQHGDLDSLFRTIEQFAKKNRPFIADSILDPIHFGFSDSIIRYYQLRQRFPDIDIMMGIGNLTELTEADTTGINAVLFGLISELHITSVLATEVSPHTRSAVREADKARRMMFAAREENSLPKGLDSSLLTTHARKPYPYSKTEIEELAQEIRDPSYRVQITEEGIYVYNRDGIISGQNPFELFASLDLLQDDAPHAFYMGVELAKAQIAWQLGKRYNQDEELDWGAAMPPVKQKQKESVAKSAHNLKDRNMDTTSIYKEEGSTLRASKKKRRNKKRAS
ncbi:MAG: dihydropteroate synthase [Gammaproteobacteria bacterium]|nr:dihydropteroate synthase [Gammaproteobacteria bacterium]